MKRLIFLCLVFGVVLFLLVGCPLLLFKVSTEIDGNGVININPLKEGYSKEEEILVEAVPGYGWVFERWDGNIRGNINPVSLTIDSDKFIKAFFVRDEFSLNLLIQGNGNVSKTPDKDEYEYEEHVSILATPDEGWSFAGWYENDSLISDDNPLDIAILQARNITALFTINQYSLTVNSENGFVTKNPDGAIYDYGTSVQLEAVPANGYHFLNWTGDLSGDTNPEYILIDSNKEVTANFEINTYSLSLYATGNGVVSKSPDEDEYDHGSSVELNAIPDTGWSFHGWFENGILLSLESNYIIPVIESKEIYGLFNIESYSLNIGVSGSGMVSKTPDKTVYEYGEVVTLNASASYGWDFSHWLGDVSDPDNIETTITINETKTATAVFQRKSYDFNLSKTGNGDITKSPDSSSFLYEQEVTLTATPSVGWSFAGWYENDMLISDDNLLNITILGERNIDALFTINDYSLTVFSEFGDVSRNPDSASYEYGSVVQLEASPDYGYEFDHWEGDLSGTDNPIDITIDEDKIATAVYNQLPLDLFSLTINIVGNGTVSRNAEKTEYFDGETVVVEASPGDSWYFSRWEGDLMGNINPKSLVMNSNKEITAVFKEEFTLDIEIQGSGIVNKNPNKLKYDENESVELEAIASSGWEFDRWEVNLSGSNNPESILMNSDKQIRAVFEELPNIPPTVSKVSGPSGNVEVNSQTFQWLGNDSDGYITNYEYRKDGGSWSTTTSSQYTWISISEGSHIFEVRAKDNDGDYSDVIIWSFNYSSPSTDGMFKVANSWGVGGWENVADGFLYITYDAMIQSGVRAYILTPDFTLEPRCIAVFEIDHPERADTKVYVGVGDPNNTTNRKEFSPYFLNGGNHPYPDNKMVLDITDLLPINDDVYLKVYDGSRSYTGTIKYFAIEYYDSYSLNNPDQIYVASGIPVNTTNYQDTIVTINNVQVNTATYVDRSFSYRYITENIKNTDFEQTDNSNIIINGYGTGLKSFSEDDIEWLKDNAKKIVGTRNNDIDSLPSSVDNSLNQYFPPIGNQANVGSCVAWSVGYYTNTYYNAEKHGWDLSGASWEGGYRGNPTPSYQDKIMSPNFIYNQINNGEDQGASYVDAINLVWNTGECSWLKFPYETNTNEGLGYCTDWPDEVAWREAPIYRNRMGALYYVKTTSYDDINTLKDLVNQGYLISISINANRYSNLTSEDIWNTSNYNVTTTNHANTIVGYID